MPYTPLFSEVLEKISKLKTKKQKVSHLKDHNTDALRMVLKTSFDPKVIWMLPQGPVPYKKMMHQREQNIVYSHMKLDSYIILFKAEIINYHKPEEK